MPMKTRTAIIYGRRGAPVPASSVSLCAISEPASAADVEKDQRLHFFTGRTRRVGHLVGENAKFLSAIPGRILIGGSADGKPAVTLAGNSQGYSESEVDAALGILESAPVVKKAIARHVKDPIRDGGRNPGRLASDPGWRLEQRSTREDPGGRPNVIYNDAVDDERCAAWSAEIIGKLKPISNGSQRKDENMPFNKGPYLPKEASACLETMRAKYDPQRRFVSSLT
jgi:hypothetical protein